jgi:hypothetical protein
MRRREATNMSRIELLALLRAERVDVERELRVQRVVRARAQSEINWLERRLREIEHGEGVLRL